MTNVDVGYAEIFDRVNDLMTRLMEETGVRYGMLLDRKGFVQVHREAKWAPRPPALDSMATLVASNAAATTALAEMLGEQTFSEQVHHGTNGSLYIETVGEEYLLTLIFDGSVPIGKVKVSAKKTVIKMNSHLMLLKTLPGLELGDDFHQTTAQLLDDLLGGG